MTETSGDEGFLGKNQSHEFPNSDSQVSTDENSEKKLEDLSLPNNLEGIDQKEALATLDKKRACEGNKGKEKYIDQGDEGKGGDNGDDGGETDHELHIWTERERRKKMKNMFTDLHALLPHLPHKVDKYIIVDEAVSYIRTLQNILQNLETQKFERVHSDATMNYNTPMGIRLENLETDTKMEGILANQGSTSINNQGTSVSVNQFPVNFQTWTSPNFTLNVCGDDAHISVCTPKKPCLLSTILYVLEKHKLVVLSVHISSDHNRSMYMIHTNGNQARDQLYEPFPVEEIYKQAAGEIIFWLNS